jgi:protein-tyrosine phosphatase
VGRVQENKARFFFTFFSKFGCEKKTKKKTNFFKPKKKKRKKKMQGSSLNLTAKPDLREKTLKQLKEHVKTLALKRWGANNQHDGFDEEFMYIERITGSDFFVEDLSTAEALENKTKNRYSNVLALESTRVKLPAYLCHDPSAHHKRRKKRMERRRSRRSATSQSRASSSKNKTKVNSSKNGQQKKATDKKKEDDDDDDDDDSVDDDDNDESSNGSFDGDLSSSSGIDSDSDDDEDFAASSSSQCGRGTCSDYVNANYITGCTDASGRGRQVYIAGQGALKETVPEFWKMVWAEDSRVIVMLTKITEGERQKCYRYWSTKRAKVIEGLDGEPLFTVTQVATPVLETEELIFRKIAIEHHPSGEVREISHFQYREWPDHGLPKSTEKFRQLLALVDDTHATTPIVVHCSAGIGRTGTFCTVHINLCKMRYATADRPPKFDILGTVLRLRKERLGMVQTKEQYMFCYLAVLEGALEWRRTFGSLSSPAPAIPVSMLASGSGSGSASSPSSSAAAASSSSSSPTKNSSRKSSASSAMNHLGPGGSPKDRRRSSSRSSASPRRRSRSRGAENRRRRPRGSKVDDNNQSE